MPKFYIENYGCQMNLSESDSLKNLILSEGYSIVDSPMNADFVIINTCSVRKTAEDRIYGRLGYYRGLKQEKNLFVKVVVMGCMAQNVGEELKKDFSDVVVAVWGTYNKQKLLDLINENSYDIVYKEMIEYKFMEATPETKFPFKAYLPISHGCNNFCSYCIVPYVRGREINRDSNEIIENVKRLLDKGVLEITLLGQNVNSYNDGRLNFPELLDVIANKTEIKRLTFLTSHPKDFSREIVEVIKSNKNILKYIHLPLQSGNNRILGLMNRKYTVEKYLMDIEMAKEIEGVVLSTDVIVGFPGETEKEFLDTIELMRSVKFNEAYMYYYNSRPNVKANELEGELPLSEKKRRLAYLIDVQNQIKVELSKTYLNNEYEVLFEALSKKNRREVFGRTHNNLIVFTEGDKNIIGTIKKFKVNSIFNNVLKGDIIY
ncbi:MAG: tRNA (N6-isopentenyl adenosine(37)-C2)-methylthiotransferase MiaB [Brevinematales bacterium]